MYFMTEVCIGPRGAQRNELNPSNLKERHSENVTSKNPVKQDEGGHFRQQEQHGPMMKARKSMAGSEKAKMQRHMTGL